MVTSGNSTSGRRYTTIPLSRTTRSAFGVGIFTGSKVIDRGSRESTAFAADAAGVARNGINATRAKTAWSSRRLMVLHLEKRLAKVRSLVRLQVERGPVSPT